jgi:hypothetical protein
VLYLATYRRIQLVLSHHGKEVELGLTVRHLAVVAGSGSSDVEVGFDGSEKKLAR